MNQYDKILRENIEAAAPGLIKNILHINAVSILDLPDSLQHTKERKPDLLKRVTDNNGNIFILHIEFQTKDDPDMAYRMAEYLVMLLRKYKISVVQYVIYIGEGVSAMTNTLTNGKSNFHYEIIALSSIDYHVFLRSKKPEEKMFAILGDFGKDSPEEAITKIFTEIVNVVNGDLEKERRKNQLRILANLRTLVSDKIKIMESVSTFFKKENDLFYIAGVIEGKKVSVKNLLLQTDFTVAKIADLCGVPEEFVEKMKEELK